MIVIDNIDSNYNGLGNQPQTGYDELVYVNNLAPLLVAKGFNAHFLVVRLVSILHLALN